MTVVDLSCQQQLRPKALAEIHEAGEDLSLILKLLIIPLSSFGNQNS